MSCSTTTLPCRPRWRGAKESPHIRLIGRNVWRWGARLDDDPTPLALATPAPLNRYGQSKQLFDLDAVLMAKMGCHPPQWADYEILQCLWSQ